ncbi:hypothetical protein BD779DRAFT_1675353 [Infundibulicybe gibba]|nr:hypothetical protein BD779DRAFT_1675353 [Infundibulicybe gibba]
MHPSHKRKHRARTTDRPPQPSPPPHEPPRALYIQAYEADITRRADVKQAAAALEVTNYASPGPDTPKVGLIRWGEEGTPGADVVWVDRYDARLLLDALPPHSQFQPQQVRPGSPGDWEELPSDTEDAFFLEPDEVEELRREKRRRVLEQQREDRVRARRIEDGEPEADEDVWGGSDEEPSEVQRELMRRTARHILGSPNPAGLEMRILANTVGCAVCVHARAVGAGVGGDTGPRGHGAGKEKSGKVQGALGGWRSMRIARKRRAG